MLCSLNLQLGPQDASKPLIWAETRTGSGEGVSEVLVMRSTKKDFSEFGVVSVITLAFAMAMSAPFLAPSPVFARSQERPSQQAEQSRSQDQNRAATFAGTVVKVGEQYDLRDSSGETFKLDDAERAKPFAGRTVKVTGELDAQAKVIHVESIEGIEG